MPVDSKHKDYRDISPKWDLVKSIVKNDAQHLIREVDSNDHVRNGLYKDGGILSNFTRLTKDGLCSLVFRKETLHEIPYKIEYIIQDATGSGLTLEQVCQKCLGEVLQTGRYGFLVDYPMLDDGEEGNARIKPYNAESIINWRSKDFGNKTKLAMVVLKEDISDVGEDGFKWETKTQYRVCYLNNNNEYQQDVYNEKNEIISQIVPLDYSGNPLDYVPFFFVGSENNDPDMDTIPLYDIAVVNLGHYRNSCDLEEASFVAGQPVPVVNVGEAGQEQFNEANPNGIKIGSRKGVVVGFGGDFKFEQVTANVLPREIMIDKEKQAAALGARLIAPPGGRETAEAAKIRYGSQHSVLYTITKNISSAIEQCLWVVAQFMLEAPEQSTYLLNDQFYEESADPNMIAQEMMLLDRGIMTVEEIRTNLKRTGMKLNEDFPQEVDPMQGVMDNEPE